MQHLFEELGLDINIEKFNPQFIKDKDGTTVSIIFDVPNLKDLLTSVQGKTIKELTKNDEIELVPENELLELLDLTPAKLKEIRTKKLKMTQKALGDRIGYSPSSIRHAETGRSPIQNRMKKAIFGLVS